MIDGNCSSLGHKLYKKRIGSKTSGKRGSNRSIVYYRIGEVMIFLYLFAKNRKDNITQKEKRELQLLSKDYDEFNEKVIKQAVKINELVRYHYEKE
ncbi:type II toxin-antitoxin system RelE/ParE family toxin [Fibrobacterota bacterium]